MDQEENLLDQDLTLTVILPGGVEKTTVVHGSKPMMDLLVTLCAKYHLNPSGHTIELITTNRNHVKFKPNALIGALEVEKIFLKPKGQEDRNKKTGPQMPEATVRLVINYKKTQKTILRVSPRVPLQELLPAICEKCEFDLQTTILLRNVHSEDSLDLNCSLNDFGLREVYARDTRVFCPVSPVSLPPSPTRSDTIRHRKDKIQKEKENKGLFGLFRKGSRKQSEQSTTVSAPASPIQRKQRPMSMSSFSAHSPTYDFNTMPSDMPKKRRAPLPPGMMSQSMPADLNPETEGNLDDNQSLAPLSSAPSMESCFRRTSTKRKAPPPPALTSGAPPDDAAQDRSVTDVLASPLEEIREQEEVSVLREQEDNSSLNLSADISLDSAHQDSEMESHDLKSADPGISEVAINGEVQSEQVMSCHVQSETDPLEERLETSAQSSESRLIVEKVSETSASSIIAPQTLDFGVQTSLLNTDSQSQCLESNTVRTKTFPEPSSSSLSEDQMQKTNPSKISFTQTEIQTQTDPTTLFNITKSDFCTELPVTQLPVAQLPVAQLPVAQLPVAQLPVAQLPVTQLPVAQLPVAQLPVAQLPVTQLPVTQLPVAQLPVTQLPVAQSTALAELKRDMATSTEELHVHETQTSTTIQSPKLPSSPPMSKSSQQHAVDNQPKPKPSNELTRDYIPKVGMTTYTIVPQMSREKMRFFEVELTLERHNDATEENQDGKTVSSPPGQSTNGTPALNGHLGSSKISQSIPPASPHDDVFLPASPSGKEKKVPPTIRPKPASFRVPLHKRMPGDYVSSAVVRRASVGSSSRPPSDVVFPPSPVHLENEKQPSDVPHPEEVDGSQSQRSGKDVEGPGFPPASCQKRLPSPVLSLEKLRSFAAPKPYSPSTPSRFAQAVLSAVKQSQSLSQRPLGHTSCIRERHEPPKNTVTDNGEEDTERCRAAPSQTAGRGDPSPCSTPGADMGTCMIENTKPSPGSEGSLATSPTLKGISETSTEE